MRTITVELVEAAACGERGALESVMERTRPVVFRIAASRLGDEDVAEDIVQTVLVKILRGLPGLRGPARYGAWVHRILRNEITGLHRAEHTRTRILRDLSDPHLADRSSQDWESRIDAQRQAAHVLKGIDALPPAQRSAVQMVDVEGFRPCEAARKMGKSLTTVRAGLCRGRERLRTMVPWDTSFASPRAAGHRPHLPASASSSTAAEIQ